MSRKKKDDQPIQETHTDLTILEAVENLSSIAEMSESERLGLIEDHFVVHNESDDEDDGLEAIQWLEEKSQHKTEVVVEDTFKAVLKYVKNFHKKEFNRFYDHKNQEGIKKIMLLVGKASDNLNSYTHLFKGVHKEGIEGVREYKQLSNFYKERIAIEHDEQVSLIDLSRKDRELEALKHPLEEEESPEIRKYHLDIEKVKIDDTYELLFLERDDGSRFYNDEFVKTLKLACNFSDYLGKELDRDPLEGIQYSLEDSMTSSAKAILKMLKQHMNIFYQEALKYKDMEVVSCVNMSLMSLMLSANPKNKLQSGSLKGTKAYFSDFQYYLRAALESFEYQKLKSFPPPSSNIFLHNLVDIISMLCWSLSFHHLDVQKMAVVMDDIIEEGKVSARKKQMSSKGPVLDQLEDNYLHISRYLMNFPVGPLFKTLQSIEQGAVEEFDNFELCNFPFEWQHLKIHDKSVSCLFLPSPTKQSLLSHVNITQEFIGLLDAYRTSKVPRKHLLINLQDRTSWIEKPRADCLEKLPKSTDYYATIDVVTLSKDSDFYHQSGAYKNLSSIKLFFKQLMFQLHSKETGFYFPEWVKERIFSGFCEKLLQQIHRFFFSSRSSLTQSERCDFIEIFYQFLTLKLIEIGSPDSMSFTCKDGLDQGSTSMSFFFAFIKILQGKKLTTQDQNQMDLILFALPMLARQRCASAQRFNRMIHGLKLAQKAVQAHTGAKSSSVVHEYFGMLFDKGFLEIGFEKPSLDLMIQKSEEKG